MEVVTEVDKKWVTITSNFEVIAVEEQITIGNMTLFFSLMKGSIEGKSCCETDYCSCAR